MAVFYILMRGGSAFTMFNVFLPKLLETAASSSAPPGGETPKTLEATLWDVVIFTLGGCPGPIVSPSPNARVTALTHGHPSR